MTRIVTVLALCSPILAFPNGMAFPQSQGECTCLADEKLTGEHGSKVSNGRLCVQSLVATQRWCDITVVERSDEDRQTSESIAKSTDLGREFPGLILELLILHSRYAIHAAQVERDLSWVEEVTRASGEEIGACLYAFNKGDPIIELIANFQCKVSESTKWLTLSYFGRGEPSLEYLFGVAPLP